MAPVPKPPLEDAILWRYIDFTKFVSLLENQALFFARADKLGDPFEGALPAENIKSLSDQERNVIRHLQRFTLISCWHESEHESTAMWKVYSRPARGVAIKTNFKDLKKSLGSNENFHIGRVQYLDYDNDEISEIDLLSPYLHKRRSFVHESEVRVISQYLPIEPNEIGSGVNIQNISENEIANLPDSFAVGTYYSIDLNLLIKEIVIDSSAPEWFLGLVKSVIEVFREHYKYKLDAPINRSSLAALP